MRSLLQHRRSLLVYALSVFCVLHLPLAPHAAAADAQSIRYGQFEVTYTPATLLDQPTVDSVSEFIEAGEEITWKMYVPETYDETKPAGLMVYISPSQSGLMPRK